MPRFRFAVKDEWGRRKTGGMDAPDLEAARKRLLQGGFEVLSLADEGQPLPDEEAPKTPGLPSKWLVVAGLTLLVSGGLLGLSGWLRRPAPRGAPVQLLRLTFSGRASGACKRVVLDLPELPLHQEATLKNGTYRFEVALKVARKPTYAWVRVTGASAPESAALDVGARELPSRKLMDLKPEQTDYTVGDLQF